LRELELIEFIGNCNLERCDLRLQSACRSKKTAKTLDRTAKHGHVTVCLLCRRGQNRHHAEGNCVTTWMSSSSNRRPRPRPSTNISARTTRFWPPSAMSADRKSTRLNSSHVKISYAVFCLKKKK